MARNTLIPFVASALGGIYIASRFVGKKKSKRPGLTDAVKNPWGAAVDYAKAEAEDRLGKTVIPEVRKLVIAGVAIGAVIFEGWQMLGRGRGD